MPELADRFGVSIRTIKRDIDELGYIIPLQTKSGRYNGGVYVMKDYRWDMIYMNVTDIELLKRIKGVGQKGGKLILNKDEIKRLEGIIAKYSIPF